MTAVFAAGLAAFLAFTYVTLVRRSETLIRDRFVHASRQVGRTIEAAVADLAAASRTVARDDAIVRFVARTKAGASTRSDSIAAADVLERLLVGRNPMQALIFDDRGRVIASSGAELPASVTRIVPTSVAPPSADDAVDAVRVGPLTPVGDRTVFWIVAPVMIDDGSVAPTAPAAYVAHPRYVGGPPDALQMLRDLTREDLTLYSRNRDGTGWTAISGAPAAAPTRRDSSGGVLWYDRPETGRQIAEESPVAGAPWTVVIEAPERTILSRLRSTVRTLALMCLLLIAAGALMSWAIGRRITRPLQALTVAADQVAVGTYEHEIAVGGRDEVGRLARRFHEMAEQVTRAQRDLQQRAEDAIRARAEAEAANRAKSDFLAMMSHELRTPLNAIGGYAELIELGIHGPITDSQRDALSRISRSQAHLLSLINDVLNFARIDAGQIQYAVQDVRMNETLAGLEALVAPQVAARSLTLRYDPCDTDIVASADADKVRQVVLNLVSNAVKFTPEGGTVTVGCDADDTTVRVYVRDTGSGIEADRLPSIFEPFVQGHRALNRPNDGVGLGLAISRDLARGMGGDVRVCSEVGVGSTFTLELPRAGTRDARAASPRTPTDAAESAPVA
ncbi:MAG TPA: HAMP domain-containing sensor histidine kinase [Gemmatimonadaceae bacterium]|nr:HAMP domain-containing sensor histidine kinase [Gemmatimonadaceae bacterium]